MTQAETKWSVRDNDLLMDGRYPMAHVAQVYNGKWRWHSNLRHSSSRKYYETRCDALMAAARAFGRSAIAAVRIECKAEAA